VTVTKAEFQLPSNKQGDSGGGDGGGGEKARNKRPRQQLSQAQYKVAMNAMKQALAWNEDDDIGVSKSRALRICVLEGAFTPSDFGKGDEEGDAFSGILEKSVAVACEKYGQIEKMTVFSKNPKGIVVVKFTTSFATQECVKGLDGTYLGTRKIRCYFWDGVANYSIVPIQHRAASSCEGGAGGAVYSEDEEEEERLKEFGDWLDNEQQELPDEFRLKSE
jgi:HIV Tat-specific factor 1